MALSAFHFLRPWWLLALLPLAWLVRRWWLAGHGQALWSQVCDAHLLPCLLTTPTGVVRRWRALALALAGTLLIVSMAGPVWHKLPQPLLQGGSALVILLDLSRSMEAADWQPSRLVRAKQKVTDLLRQRREGLTALLVFAGEGFVVTPLTQDRATITLQMAALQPTLMPVQGSRPDRAVAKALLLLRQSGILHGQLLLLTDGWEGEEAIAAQVAKAGHRLSIIGVGTEQGAPIPLPDGGFVKDADGAIVLAKLDERRLLRLARAGGGDYQPMQSSDQDWQILLLSSEPGENSTASDAFADQWHEEGPWLLLLALPLLALAYRRGFWWLWVVSLLLPQPVQAMSWAEWWQTPDRQAMELLQQKKAGEAAERFADPLWRGTAWYQAGEKAKAIAAWQEADSLTALYNTGTVLAEQGHLTEAAQALQEVLRRQPDHADAKHNLQAVQKALQTQASAASSGQAEQKPTGQPSEPGPEQKQQAAEPQQSAAAAKPQANQPAPQTSPQHQPQASHQEQEGSQQPENIPWRQAESTKESEAEKTAQLWMRRVPDDPGGLLRRKFLYHYQRENQAPGRPQERMNPW
ncbi:MAG: VWA domain-containing protein [Magnetococcales bacterium]|nr:VWA domain-containing protein [Magnetococcales bacterium]